MPTAPQKIALVTGANRGIGLAIAKLLASSHPTHHVLLGARDPSLGATAISSLRTSGLTNVSGITLDLSSDDSINAAYEHISSTYGHLDVLIHNAGTLSSREFSSPSPDFRSLAKEEFEVNYFGVGQLTEAFLPLLEASPTGPRIVFISNTLSSLAYSSDPESRFYIGGASGLPLYRSAKTAINMLMCYYAALGREKGKEGKVWKVNACCPGYVATRLTGFKGPGTVESGAVEAVRLATLGEGGETGTFSEKEGKLPW